MINCYDQLSGQKPWSGTLGLVYYKHLPSCSDILRPCKLRQLEELDIFKQNTAKSKVLEGFLFVC